MVGQLLDRPQGLIALGRRKVIALLDAVKLATQSPEPSTPGSRRQQASRACSGNQLTVLRGDGGLQPRYELPLLSLTDCLGDPQRRLPTRVGDLVGEPLELLPVATIEREADKSVEELRGPQALEFAPDGDPGGRWLPGQDVGEEDPTVQGGQWCLFY